MLIGDLSKKVGVSIHTIRYYEELGLIKVARKERRENNYKEYSTAVLERILVISRLKTLGFTLVEIKSILDIFLQKSNPCLDILDSVSKKITLIESKVQDLLEIKSKQENIQKNCNGNCFLEDILPVCVKC